MQSRSKINTFVSLFIKKKTVYLSFLINKNRWSFMYSVLLYTHCVQVENTNGYQIFNVITNKYSIVKIPLFLSKSFLFHLSVLEVGKVVCNGDNLK